MLIVSNYKKITYIKNILKLVLFIILGVFINYSVFSSQETPIYSTWVALSLNIWLQKTASINSLNTIKSIDEIIEENKLMSNKYSNNTDFIETNLNNILKYKNILNIKIIDLLTKTEDKKSTIDSYIKLLSYYQYKINNKINFLQKEHTSLQEKLNAINTRLNTNKNNIWVYYSKLESENLNKESDRYVSLKETEASVKIKKSLTENFIKTYNSLNINAEKLKQAIITNKESLIKWVKIVVPDNNMSELKELGLIK